MRRINVGVLCVGVCMCVYIYMYMECESWHAVLCLESLLKEFVTDPTVNHLWQKTTGVAADLFLLFVQYG